MKTHDRVCRVEWEKVCSSTSEVIDAASVYLMSI
jgi:hypothetical protein